MDPEILNIPFSTVVEIFLMLLALVGTLIGIIWANLKNEIKDIKIKIHELEQEIKDYKERASDDIHALETQQMTMMSTIVQNYVSKEDCNKIESRLKEGIK